VCEIIEAEKVRCGTEKLGSCAVQKCWDTIYFILAVHFSSMAL
jgi:hypothetical protein